MPAATGCCASVTVGNDSHGSHYPGLLERTPALSLEERIVAVGDGRGVADARGLMPTAS